MIAGQIVIVDWRDAIAGSWEANKKRPGIVVSSADFSAHDHRFEIVVPLSGRVNAAIPYATTLIAPTPQNGCTKPCFALAWNVQSVSHVRLTETSSMITDDELRDIRAKITDCIYDR
jgi:mRNA-degrading endonuclease toxin of MazEF toxin-antitoxin module